MIPVKVYPVPGCNGCFYWVHCGGVMICDYSGYHEHLRSSICPPGKDCTVRSDIKPEDKAPGRRLGTMLWNEKKAKELYDAGYTDAAIAEAVGTRKNNIFAWRKRRKLPANGKRTVSYAEG